MCIQKLRRKKIFFTPGYVIYSQAYFPKALSGSLLYLEASFF